MALTAPSVYIQWNTACHFAQFPKVDLVCCVFVFCRELVLVVVVAVVEAVAAVAVEVDLELPLHSEPLNNIIVNSMKNKCQ